MDIQAQSRVKSQGKRFNLDPSFNRILVIGSGVQTVADKLLSACDIAKADSLPEKVDAIDDCVQAVKDALVAA